MKFVASGPSIPDLLLDRRDAGRVVFLCGAGVSKESGMPNFLELTQYVISHFCPPTDSEIMAAFKPWKDGTLSGNVPLDQIFNLLHLEYGKDEVNALVTKKLSEPVEVRGTAQAHALIKRISSNQSGAPQIVTTNFDLLFEEGHNGVPLAIHQPPAFPDINFGSKIEGVTYLHGRLVHADSEVHPYVLSSADFGRAYLSEGWATNFIRQLLERYTVVLIGYQAEDPPIKYLLQGLNHDGKYDRSRLYAFDRGRPEEIEVKWRDRGVTAIAFSDYPDLWKSIEAWADRAENPRKWRSSVISKCQRDPKDLEPHERGQVAHVLRTVQGARAFSQSEPIPHPEWICVMDANVRSANMTASHSADKEIFDPRDAYGLDDDLRNISDDERRQGVSNDNLLVWRHEDENPHECHQLGGRFPEGYEPLPKRLYHLINWIGKCIESPVIAWWAVRQNGLHPSLMRQLEWQLEKSKIIHKRARHIWNLVLEYHRDSRNRHGNFYGDWFDFKSRVITDGWSASTLREFKRVCAPRLSVDPPHGVAGVRPPLSSWDEINLSELGRWSVVFFGRHNEDLEVTDAFLPHVFGVLEEALRIAAGLLSDIDTIFFDTPTCYPGRDVDGTEHVTDGAEVMTWFLQLFDRMAANWPELAKAHATTWSMTDKFFFRKLKLFAFNKLNAFEADYVAKAVLALEKEIFWSSSVRRELLFLLVDRWREFSQEHRENLSDCILAGPDKNKHCSDEDFPQLRNEFVARYGRHLELSGCEVTKDFSRKLTEIINDLPEWSDSWAAGLATSLGSHSGLVSMDENPEVVLHLPVNEIIPKALESVPHEFGLFIERRPFKGLVKINPRKALSALSLAGKKGDYPQALWSSMISDLPADINPRLRRVLLNRITRLPCSVVIELRHVLSRWLEDNLGSLLEFDDALGWRVYDYIVDCILSGGAEAMKSGLGEINQGRKVIKRSRRTFSHAVNGPIGICVRALCRAVPGKKQDERMLVPNSIKHRVERLLDAPGDGADHAASIIGNGLNWLMSIDPVWTEKNLISMLTFEHPLSEPAWNGFLYSENVPPSSLLEIIKPLLLRIFPWIESLNWDRDLTFAAGGWLGYMRAFNANKTIGLSSDEMRVALRAMSDDTRNRFIFWLGRVGQKNEAGWIKYVIPLINGDWPRERKYRTAASIKAWIHLLDDTEDDFPAVYESVKKFLGPVEVGDNPFINFTREGANEYSLTVRFPETTLDLMNRTTPQTVVRLPYELPKILALIAETNPNLTSDPRYLRLIDLVERS